MSKRVHEIAKERGLPPKEVLQRLQAAGLKVKAVSSSVDEADARRVLGDGNGAAQSQAPGPQATGSEQPRREARASAGRPAGGPGWWRLDPVPWRGGGPAGPGRPAPPSPPPAARALPAATRVPVPATAAGPGRRSEALRRRVGQPQAPDP